MSEIDIEKWGIYQVGDLFDIHPTKAYPHTNAYLMSEYGTNPVVVNSQYNNGIGGFSELETTESGGIITFSDTTSSNSIFYQSSDFIGYAHVQGMYPIGVYAEKWTRNCLIFFAVVFKKQASLMNYSYSNKFTRADASKMFVRLPSVESGDPDWEFMEYFIKNKEDELSKKVSELMHI